MKRLIFPCLLLAACSAAPPAPLPPAPSPPAQAEVRAPWIELTEGVPTPAPKPRRTTKVVGRAPDGGKRFEVTLPHPPAAIIPMSDGGAFAVLDEPTKHSPGKALATRGLIRLDPKGTQMTFIDKTPMGRHCIKNPDAEKPTGEWNTLDLYCFGDTAVHLMNGKVVMVLYKSRRPAASGGFEPLKRGKIQIQSEGAEIFYRNIRVLPIAQLPAEFSK